MNQDLNVVLLTSSVETRYFENLFEEVSAVTVHGVLKPVDVQYLPIDMNYTESMRKSSDVLISVLMYGGEGNILVFMSGDIDFEFFFESLKEKLTYISGELGPVNFLMIYSDFVSNELCTESHTIPVRNSTQSPRKVYFVSSKCEHHLLDDIRFIIDCGWTIKKAWRSDLCQVVNVPCRISKTESNRRALAGGSGPNSICYRVYSKNIYFNLPLLNQSEGEFRDLSKIILITACLGDDLKRCLQYECGLNQDSWQSGVKSLEEIGALSSDFRITEIGKFIMDLPIPTGLGKALYESTRSQHFLKIIDCIAVISSPGILPSRFLNENFPHSPSKTQFIPIQQPKDVVEEPKLKEIVKDSQEDCLNLMKKDSNSLDYIMMMMSECDLLIPSTRGKWCRLNRVSQRQIEKSLVMRDVLRSALLKLSVTLIPLDPTYSKEEENNSIVCCLLKGSFNKLAIEFIGDSSCYLLPSEIPLEKYVSSSFPQNLHLKHSENEPNKASIFENFSSYKLFIFSELYIIDDKVYPLICQYVNPNLLPPNCSHIIERLTESEQSLNGNG